MAFLTSPRGPVLVNEDIPDDLSLDEFVFNDHFRPHKCEGSPRPFIDSVDGEGYTVADTRRRVEWLAAGLLAHLEIDMTTEDVFSRVVSIFTVNNKYTPTISWAILRLNGIVAPANAAFLASELAQQLQDSGTIALFTCPSRLSVALEAAKLAGISSRNVFLVPIPGEQAPVSLDDQRRVTFDDLISAGNSLPPVPRRKWTVGQGRRQVAYICYSSGTSGTPKGVMISHFNIIANIIQVTLHESTFRPQKHRDRILGVLPQSHIYAVVLMTHVAAFRGDTVVTMAQFKLDSFIRAVKRFELSLLYVVPPILIALAKQTAIATDRKTFDLPSVRRIYSGAAPLTKELSAAIKHRYPKVVLGQGYGMTEAPTVIASHPADVYDGSSGCLLPGVEARIVDAQGREVVSYDVAGELFIKGPQVALGYLKRPEATAETFSPDGWLRTGDEVELRPHPETGEAHLFVVDRTKELIKVSGYQVAPAELEGHLLTHPMVADCAVIPIQDERSGEVPKAIVVLRPDCNIDQSEASRQLIRWVADHKSKQKKLRGGVEFALEIPKSPSGKILRRLLRDREKARSSRDPMARL